MKKQRRGAQKKKKASAAAAAAEPARRDFLKLARNGAIGAGVVGLGGWWAYSEVQAGVREADLGRIGQGVPMVVQIHDPTCPQCAQLQRYARRAVARFDEADLQFAVASLTTLRGRRLAATHGVGHVTLILFDGAGRRREVMRGVRSPDQLEAAFRQAFRIR